MPHDGWGTTGQRLRNRATECFTEIRVVEVHAEIDLTQEFIGGNAVEWVQNPVRRHPTKDLLRHLAPPEHLHFDTIIIRIGSKDVGRGLGPLLPVWTRVAANHWPI